MISCSELKKANPYLFNSWRAILYTEKGKRAGVVDGWRNFQPSLKMFIIRIRKGFVCLEKIKINHLDLIILNGLLIWN